MTDAERITELQAEKARAVKALSEEVRHSSDVRRDCLKHLQKAATLSNWVEQQKLMITELRKQLDSAEARCKALEGLLRSAAHYVRLSATADSNPFAADVEMQIRTALSPAPEEQEK